MPIYAYRCGACGFEKDVLQKMSDAPLTQCPSCQSDQFAKRVTAAGFQLKGSGWYVTDFRNNGSSGGGKAGGVAGNKASGVETGSDASGSDTGSSANAPASSNAAGSGPSSSAPASTGSSAE